LIQPPKFNSFAAGNNLMAECSAAVPFMLLGIWTLSF